MGQFKIERTTTEEPIDAKFHQRGYELELNRMPGVREEFGMVTSWTEIENKEGQKEVKGIDIPIPETIPEHLRKEARLLVMNDLENYLPK